MENIRLPSKHGHIARSMGQIERINNNNKNSETITNKRIKLTEY